MANEIHCPGKNADTYYAFVKRRTDKYIYDVGDTAFEAVGTWNDARIDECDIEMTAEGDTHYADFPVVAAGVYDVEYRKQVGVNPDTDDKAEFISEMHWNGTAETSITTLLVDTEPAGAPATWNLQQWFSWLIRRFSNKQILTDDADGTGSLVVKKDDDVTNLTSQEVSEVGLVQTVDKLT